MIVVWSVGVIWQLLSLALVIENHRYTRSRLGSTDKWRFQGNPPVELIICCKGLEPGLLENLAAFANQKYPVYSIQFVVERGDDPAVDVINKAILLSSTCCSVLVAGLAVDSGQKIQNLRYATSHLRQATDIVVFADSDIRPEPGWLDSIVKALEINPVCVTGYRWMIPARPSLANMVAYSLNASVACTLGRGKFNLAWGGSWAIRKKEFDRLRISDAWKGALSDDLVASRVLKRAGIAINYDPNLLSSSPVNYSMSAAFEFVRRQLLITRHHFPGYWLGGLVTLGLILSAFWAPLVGGISMLVNDNSTGWLALSGAVMIFALQAAKGILRHRIASLRFPKLKSALRPYAIFDTLGFPISGPFLLFTYLLSGIGNVIHWRGNGYLLGRSKLLFARGNPILKIANNGRIPVNPLESFTEHEKQAA